MVRFITKDGKRIPIDDNKPRLSSNGRNDEAEGMIIGNGTRIPTKKVFTARLREPVPSSSQIQGIMDTEFKKTKFAESPMVELQAEKEAFEKGFNRGSSFLEGAVNVLGKVEQGSKTEDLDIFVDPFEVETIDTKSDLEDVLLNSAHDAEQNDRQSSDFSFLAKEINDLQFGDTQDEQMNDAWEAFQEGIDQGISFALSQVEVLKGDA